MGDFVLDSFRERGKGEEGSVTTTVFSEKQRLRHKLWPSQFPG